MPAETSQTLVAPSEPRVPDQTRLRDLIPANRKRAYAVRDVIGALFDEGSVLELRRGFGRGMVTALARVDGKALGVIANDPSHLGGAIDAEGADKAARFAGLCDAFGVPLVFLADTPGFMVGPESEKTATVRHFSRMFVTGANLGVPTGTVVLRGRGIGMASYFEIDDVIDPVDTRRWIATLFDEATPRWFETPGKRRPYVDAW